MPPLKQTPSDDASTTIANLKQQVARFVEERDWSQFHAPKNLSMALAIEAAELMEHFQWLSVEASREISQDPEKRQGVEEEIADVLCYTLALANELKLDVTSVFQAKMQKNEAKYPADVYQGKYKVEK